MRNETAKWRLMRLVGRVETEKSERRSAELVGQERVAPGVERGGGGKSHFSLRNGQTTSWLVSFTAQA